jgi:hypothetical protein
MLDGLLEQSWTCFPNLLLAWVVAAMHSTFFPTEAPWRPKRKAKHKQHRRGRHLEWKADNSSLCRVGGVLLPLLLPSTQHHGIPCLPRTSFARMTGEGDHVVESIAGLDWDMQAWTGFSSLFHPSQEGV